MRYITIASALFFAISGGSARAGDGTLDDQVHAALQAAGFTGGIESRLEARLGRPVNSKLAELGRLLFFDKILALHSDNSCAGCHAPQAGFGDTQSIAIGIQNNNFVGAHRIGPRNQRRTPMLVNDAFYPKLMWNARFSAISGDPFDNSQGFLFPDPESTRRFPANDPDIRHLLIAQAHMPPTELTESAGFTGTQGSIGPEFDLFDDGLGIALPAPDDSGFRNEPIRVAVTARINASAEYRARFAEVYSDGPGKLIHQLPVTYVMIAKALAEFQFTLVASDAPIDRFARGDASAMTDSQKRGALLFFGQAGCVSCHAVAGQSNEMFSDFRNHRIAVPQLAPVFGVGKGNVEFDGPLRDEDFGAGQLSNDPADRYAFRTSPLRNVALQPAFFHDGAFTRLEDAIRHHLNAAQSAQMYDPAAAGVAPDLSRVSSAQGLMTAALDPLLTGGIALRQDEFNDLLAFVRDALLDDRARPEKLCAAIPASLPSGMPLQRFEGCAGYAPDRNE